MVLTACIAAGAILLASMWAAAQRELEARGALLAHTMARSITPSLSRGDHETIQRLIDQVAEIPEHMPEVVRLMVVDSTHHIMAHSDPTRFGEGWTEGSEIREGVEYIKGAEPRLVVRVPVGSEFRFGTLQAELDPRKMSTGMRTSAQMTILVLLLTFAALVMGLSSLLNQSVSVPIRRLVRAVCNYRGEGPSLDLAPEGPDEVKQLLLAFNEMAAAIYRQTEDLENAVEERTRELQKVNSQLAAANGKLADLAVTDELTGIANRRAFVERLNLELERSRRLLSPLSLVLFDIDHFKALNDTKGHLEGDAALVKVASVLKNGCRSVDLAARWGGEEFALLLPETCLDEATLVGEKIRLMVENRNISGGITVSGGVATLPDHARCGEELVAAADMALYESKRSGRNRITTPEMFEASRMRMAT